MILYFKNTCIDIGGSNLFMMLYIAIVSIMRSFKKESGILFHLNY